MSTPTSFGLDYGGRLDALQGQVVNPEGAPGDKILEGAENCPVSAITAEMRKPGKKLPEHTRAAATTPNEATQKDTGYRPAREARPWVGATLAAPEHGRRWPTQPAPETHQARAPVPVESPDGISHSRPGPGEEIPHDPHKLKRRGGTRRQTLVLEGVVRPDIRRRAAQPRRFCVWSPFAPLVRVVCQTSAGTQSQGSDPWSLRIASGPSSQHGPLSLTSVDRRYT